MAWRTTSMLTTSTLTLFISMLSLQTTAQNNFTITAQFFRYSNPTSRIGSLPNQPCCNDIDCDEGCVCNEDCYNYFIFCLRQPSEDHQDTMCPYGRYQTGVLSGGDSIIFVSGTDGQQSREFNIPNPFTFDNLDNQEILQLLVRTMDDNSGQDGGDVLVEWFSSDIVMRRGNMLRTTVEGQFGVGTIRLSYEVSCSENYYGELCDVFCEGRNDSLGHYTCDDMGNVVCLSGFTNPSTFCTCTTTSEECVNIDLDGDFEGGLERGAVVGAVIGILTVFFLVVIVVILAAWLLWRKREELRNSEMFSHLCCERASKKDLSTYQDCSPQDNPMYTEEAISIQGSSTGRSLASSHNYDYIANHTQQVASHRSGNAVNGTADVQYSYAENEVQAPAAYSYAENNNSKTVAQTGAQVGPYSYVDNTLIQDLVLQAVHQADAQRLRTLENHVDISQHYETMENYQMGATKAPR